MQQRLKIANRIGKQQVDFYRIGSNQNLQDLHKTSMSIFVTDISGSNSVPTSFFLTSNLEHISRGVQASLTLKKMLQGQVPLLSSSRVVELSKTRYSPQVTCLDLWWDETKEMFFKNKITWQTKINFSRTAIWSTDLKVF